MKSIIVYNLLLPILCYAIGVICGIKSTQVKIKPFADEDEIQHVEYTHDQMGYDK